MTTFRLLLIVFGVIFVAELPDKTALASLVLATHYESLPVFLGASLALTLQSVIAVAAGGLLSTLPKPPRIQHGLMEARSEESCRQRQTSSGTGRTGRTRSTARPATTRWPTSRAARAWPRSIATWLPWRRSTPPSGSSG
jgi:Uncharacterized protein family UPF0016